jgi:hypothetical protein
MTTLTRDLRRQLENTVRLARRVAEGGAGKSLEQFGIAQPKAPVHLSPTQVKLRNALRAHSRQLGDARNTQTGVQATARLTTEFAYEHWHRMLFARFLAENGLLIEPDSGIAISLTECQELARARNEEWLVLVSRYAQAMLPQIFRTNDPVLEMSLPPETRSQLEDLLNSLPRETFTAEDSLGWVYQYWQADNKEAVNRSENKIGAEQLPAVTQLFTEDYMVWFLLHNTLGAWWAGKVLAKNPDLAKTATSEAELRIACAVGGIAWAYLRFGREGEQAWRPAAGTFAGWPKQSKDITLLDPCMGSGHFLVFALPILAAIRAYEEGLTEDGAIEAVLRENLFGLELDARCTQIAAFNLALAAWKRTGYRKLPALNLACSGLSLGVTKTEWFKLAERAAAELPVAADRDLFGTKADNLFSDATRRGFERMYDLFARAPMLGSLIQPRSDGDLVEHGFTDLEPLLTKVLAQADTDELSEMAVAAQGVAKAAQILAGQFTLVATNVPYLGRGKQEELLKEFCDQHHRVARANLATAFTQRALAFCGKNGTCAAVTPNEWLFLGTYKRLRQQLLSEVRWNLVVQLGPNAFQDMNWWAAKTSMVVLTRSCSDDKEAIAAVSLEADHTPADKARSISARGVLYVSQARQLKNPDATLILEGFGDVTHLLSEHVDVFQGVGTTDLPRYVLRFWELAAIDADWEPYQLAPVINGISGLCGILRWQRGGGELATIGTARKGLRAKSMIGFGVAVTGHLYRTRFFGSRFDNTLAVLIPKDPGNLNAVAALFFGEDFIPLVRKVDQALSVTESSFVKVPFDLLRWREIATDQFPEGLPKPSSADPTQWLFSGHPLSSGGPLQVAVARLVGYRWPRQTGSSFPDSPALGPDGSEPHAAHTGIVSLSAIKGEAGAAERIVALLSGAYGAQWSAAKLNNVLAGAGHAGGSLADWLHDYFFEEHCALFHQRPFVWHVWDGRRDGFNALVNYHRLAAGNGEGKRLLEKLTHTYLGDWIDAQRRESQAGAEGADARLAAAEHLKAQLEKILIGEPPYDLFVRWKSLAEQSVGWEADINDGVRMNIRPFMTARPFGARARNACILRTTPKIKWDKDRGKEPERSKQDFPWFWGWDESTPDFAGGAKFDGNRWNDLHYTTAAKKDARTKRGGK